MARNDDPEYVRSLERALEAAELEIKGLEGELREKDKILAEMQEQLAPTHMGEPLITRAKARANMAAHYPEEWGPSDNRRLTCVCGNPDPFHSRPNVELRGGPAVSSPERPA